MSLAQQTVTTGKIEVRDIVKVYGKVTAVNGVSFSVKDGEVLGLLGPSGCGKTTILRCIAGLENMSSGEILLDGQVVNSTKPKVFVPPEKRKLGFVFQNYALWPNMTVKQNIAYCIRSSGLPKSEVEPRTKEALALVGLTGYEDRYPSQISGGQQQRVALARNLSYHPKVLLLDEPLSNLDMKVREKVRGELRIILKKIGITTVFVTHDQEEAFVISDRTILMNQGKIIQEGTPHQLYARPANSFVAEFIGRTNVLKAELIDVNQDTKTARVRVPEMGVEMLCEYTPDSPKSIAYLIVRYNEMSISSKPMDGPNVFKGTVTFREYRGSVTDHKIQIGNAQIIATTHRFCGHADEAPTSDTIYVSIPPSAVRLLPS